MQPFGGGGVGGNGAGRSGGRGGGRRGSGGIAGGGGQRRSSVEMSTIAAGRCFRPMMAPSIPPHIPKAIVHNQKGNPADEVIVSRNVKKCSVIK